MWRNYLTVGVRSLMKNRTYAFINIVGLAIGLAACLMILLFVRYEQSYDRWLPNHENTYQLQSHFRDPDTGEEQKLQMTSYVAGTRLKADYPQIERSVYFQSSEPVLLRGGEATLLEEVLLTDGAFFDVLRFPLLQGNPANALGRPNTVVLAQDEAQRLFGSANPIGQTITIVTRGQQIDLQVTGIAAEPPRNSHVRFNMVARLDFTRLNADTPDFLTQFGWQSGWFYFTLRPGSDPDTIRNGMPAWERRNIPDQRFGNQTFNQGENQDFLVVNIADVHLGIAQEGAMTPGNDAQTLLTFSIVALLILGMACVNFTNLATARASQRAREVALRKVLGANRKQLMLQFLVESILVTAVAMLLATAFVELLLPYLSGFLEADLRITYFGEGGVALPILLLVLIVGTIGGVYPAFYLTRFQPAQVLKANKSSAEPSGTGRLRSMLVVGQFAVSIGLIICTAVVYGQTVYARTADPGYKREGLIQVESIGRRQLADQAETIVREIERVPGVVAAGRSGIGIATRNNTNTGVQVPGAPEPVSIGQYGVTPGFFGTMDIKLLAGRLLEENRPGDRAARSGSTLTDDDQRARTNGMNVVVNRLAAQRLGFREPQEAVGKTLNAALVDEEFGVVPITIVGVVADARFRSIREPLDPIMFYWDPYPAGALVIRHDGTDPSGVMARIENTWKRFAPEVPFDGRFSEDIMIELYEAEEARAQVFAGFALLAVIVACLGLFGLAAFTAERRTKEIGIRKVLGARTRDIVQLLAWQFSKPVIVANLIAWPVAWWVMRDWLNTFDTRVDLGPGPFLLAGFVALAIAIGTIAGHAIRVARANPINALRYE